MNIKSNLPWLITAVSVMVLMYSLNVYRLSKKEVQELESRIKAEVHIQDSINILNSNLEKKLQEYKQDSINSSKIVDRINTREQNITKIHQEYEKMANNVSTLSPDRTVFLCSENLRWYQQRRDSLSSLK